MTFTASGLRAVFSAHGRLGRVRYIVCRSAIVLVFGLVYIGLSLLTGILPPDWRVFMGLLILLAVIVALVAYVLPAARRAHDFNASGWLALLSLVPLVNLLFWFIPGTAGGNRHGEAPLANTWRPITLAIFLPLLVLLMFLYFGWAGVKSYIWSSSGRESTVEQSAPDPNPEQ